MRVSTAKRLPGLPLFVTVAIVAAGLALGLPAAASAYPPSTFASGAGSTGATTAVLDGTVVPGNNPTTYQVEWDLQSSDWCTSGGQSGSAANSTPSTDVGYTDNAPHDVAVPLTGLTEDVQYCAALVASNVEGDYTSSQVQWWQGQPDVATTGVSVTGLSKATVGGQIVPHHQVVFYYLGYGPASSAWCANPSSSGGPPDSTDGTLINPGDDVAHDVSFDIGNLDIGTAYCAAVITSSGYGEKTYGAPVTWTQSMPDAATWDAYSTAPTAATVEGDVNTAGDSTTTYQVQYDLASSDWCQSAGASGSPSSSTAPTSAGLTLDSTAYQNVTVDLSGLAQGQDYCGQIVATNDTGETDGGQVWWTEGAPTTDTYDANPGGYTTATVDGDVNPAGTSTSYVVRYDLASSTWCQSYGLSGSPTQSTPAAVLSATDGTFHDVAVPLSGLSPGMDYCGEVVAANAGGEGDSFPVFWTQPAPPLHTLTVALTGSSRTYISSSPAGISCGGPFASVCAYGFPEGAKVTLTASSAPGSALSWVNDPGCAPHSQTCTVTMNADETIDAVVSQAPPPVQAGTVSVMTTGGLSGAAPGTITSSPAGIDCGTAGSVCMYPFPVGTHVTLTATPDPGLGATFAGWSGGGCSGTGTCTVTVAASMPVITATFDPGGLPRCVVVPSSKLALKGAQAGRVTVQATCDQDLAFSLNIDFTVQWKARVRGAHGKLRWKTVRDRGSVRDAHGSAHAHVTTTVTLRLPRGALSRLVRHRSAFASLSFDLVGINDNGSGGGSASLKHVR